MNERNIKPCPFCGEEEKLHIIALGKSMSVACFKCDGDGPWKPAEEEAIAAWNARVTEEELTKTQAENAAIIAVLKKYKHVIDANDYILCSSEKIMEILSNSSTAGQDLLDRLAQAEKDRDKARAENTKLLQETNELLSRAHGAEQREKQLRDIAQTLFDSLESLMDSVNDCEEGYPPDVDLKRLINTVDDARSVLQQTEKEGAE